MSAGPSRSGIVTDQGSGERHIPESVRADGTTRKAIKIRPGYRPPEDVEVYKNRTAETFRNRGNGGIPGADGLKDQKQETPSSAASNKNAKRREARKKAKSANEAQDGDAMPADPQDQAAKKADEVVDPEAEREKKARNLKKKLKQAKELKSKKEGGEALLPEQIAKVIKINELVRELEALGFDTDDGEPKAAAEAGTGE
ncbi:putative RNA binding protein Pym [Xylariomycetidae sp. FL2044]|nr:putative RNA binding protein Pym [Xylariomycetidae sp. FL2044]